jgi:hypothetical protein
MCECESEFGENKMRVFALALTLTFVLWAQLGSNQRPPDYESGATNQLSYGPLRKNGLQY